MSHPQLRALVALAEVAAEGGEVEPLEVELRDGSRALLRPIRPDDKERLRHGLDWLSPRSRYLAFHDRLDHLTDEQLRYVTEIDHRDHVAWVALDADDPEAPGMGIGRYVRLSHATHVAEAAITVVDRYQGLGLGTLLLAVLTAVARANGIEVFRNYVLAENEAMLGLFDELGATRQLITSSVYEVDFALPDDPDELPDTPAGRAIRAFAQGPPAAPTLAFTLPPVWIRRLRRRRGSAAPPTPPVPEGWRERGPFGDWLDASLEPGSEDEAEDAGDDGSAGARGTPEGG